MADHDSENGLKSFRVQIDAIDQEILRLISERAALAHEIGKLKKGMLYRPEREAQVLRKVSEANPGPLADDTVVFLFREIMSACLALERPVTVAYLGPQGTYSERAATRHFGHAAHFLPCSTLDEVFRATETGQADFSVVPVENSTEGAVARALDLMIQTPLMVCGEVLLRIRHQLWVPHETGSLEEVSCVYSHAQSLAQCQQWLNHHLPAAERLPVSSNAEAVRQAAIHPGAAAIAGESAGERHGLKVLFPHIEDDPNNTTRFMVFGPESPAPSGRDKTSLVLAVRNRPGAVHELLSPLAHFGVSMTRLESRPSRMALWEYVFFVDVEGHQTDGRVVSALEVIKSEALMCKVLGSYPVAMT